MQEMMAKRSLPAVCCSVLSASGVHSCVCVLNKVSSSQSLYIMQEDVAVMQQIDGRMVLSCGAVVSPLGWSASQKLGMDLRGIHDSVPHFNDGPAAKFVSNILEKGLRAGVPLARANWFIMDTDEHSLVGNSARVADVGLLMFCVLRIVYYLIVITVASQTSPSYPIPARMTQALISQITGWPMAM